MNARQNAPNKAKPLVPPLLREVGKLAAGVACVSTNSGASATGNFRNKYALQPGHSLMDWIRLGASGKDLTGVGSRAGHLPVTPSELALHNKETDAWLCIRGRVFNVTAYLPFHPGGPDELMRAAGKDATSLFEQVHPWVNFEQILQKCYIGPLRSAIEMDQEELFGNIATKMSKSTKSTDVTTPPTPLIDIPKDPTLPKFDWIQKLEYITAIFYTGCFSNPMIEVKQTHKTINIFLTYDNATFNNEISFFKDVQWPCMVKVTCETGKIECVFRKTSVEIWENYGVLKQSSRSFSGSLMEVKLKCKVINKMQVNYNTFLIEIERNDLCKTVVPLGKHIKVFDNIKGEEISRSYTPVPKCLFTKLKNQTQTSDSICLMVKRYSDGNLSKILPDSQIGDTITISKPLGTFKLQNVDRRETFIILAAGTGITPMFSIILFLLERRIRKCQSLRLLFFNRSIEDILFQNQFDELAIEDPRLKIHHVLSQPPESWDGLKGHISRPMLENILSTHLENTTYIAKDVYIMACGPTIFTTLAEQILQNLGFDDTQMHFFFG